MGREVSYAFSELFVPAKGRNVCQRLNASQNPMFLSEANLHTAFEKLRAEHIPTVFHLAFLDAAKHQGPRHQTVRPWPAAGKGPVCGRPECGAAGGPSSPAWRARGARRGVQETQLSPLSPFAFSFSTVSILLTSERATVALLSPCPGLSGGKEREGHAERRLRRSETCKWTAQGLSPSEEQHLLVSTFSTRSPTLLPRPPRAPPYGQA